MLITLLVSGIVALNPVDSVAPKLIEARETEDCGAPESVTLLQFSDLHGDTENLQRVADFKKAYDKYIDDAIHCGDAVMCYSDDVFPWDVVWDARGILNTVGNHDCWKGHKVWAQSNHPYDATIEDAFDIVFVGKEASRPFYKDWNIIKPVGKCTWYYKDYNQVRMIVIDVIHFFEPQKQWFSETLSDARKSGKVVVVVGHYQPQSGLTKIESGFSSNMEAVDPVPDPGESQMERLTSAAFDEVDRFILEGGTFACWLAGHTHLDMIGQVTGHPKQMMVTVDKAGQKDMYMGEKRIRGEKSQDAFNLVTINPSRNIVTVDRIGCNIDENGRSKNRFRFNYLTGEVLVNE